MHRGKELSYDHVNCMGIHFVGNIFSQVGNVGNCGLQYFICALHYYTPGIKTSVWNYSWK